MSHAIMIPEIGHPDVMRPTTLATPRPGTGEVLIRNHASAVNFIDTIIRRGKIRQDMMPALPHVPGVEGAGIVETLGRVSMTFKSVTASPGWGRLAQGAMGATP